MIVYVTVAVILAARTSNCEVKKEGHQPVGICSNPARLYPDPADCRKFFRCINRKHVSMSCPSKTAFDPDNQICAWREDMSSCNKSLHKDVTGQRSLQTETTKFPILTTRAPVTKQNKEFPRHAKVNTSPSFATETLRQQKVTKVHQETLQDKTTKQNIELDTDSQVTRPIDLADFSVHKTSLIRMDTFQSTSTTMNPIALTTSISTDRAVTLGDGDKWYHKMNDVAVTTSTLSQSVEPSDYSRAASSRFYDTDKDKHVTKVGIEKNTYNNVDSTARDHYPRLDSDNDEPKPLTSMVDFIGEAASSPEPTNGVSLGSVKDISMESIEHFRTGNSRNASKKHITNDSVRSTQAASTKSTRDFSGSSSKDVIVKGSRDKDIGNIKGDKVESAKDGKVDRAEGYQSLISDEVSNSTSEHSARNFEEASIGMHVTDHLLVVTDNDTADVPARVAVGIDVLEAAGLLNSGKDNQVKSFQNMTVTSNSSSPTINLTINSTYDASKLGGHEAEATGGDEELSLPQLSLKGQNLTYATISSNQSDPFDKLAHLIQPYAARIDRKSFRMSHTIAENSLPAQSTPAKESDVDSKQTVRSSWTDILPETYKGLTGKVVNRHLFQEALKERVKPKWYDPQVRSSALTNTISPTTINEALINSRYERKDMSVEFGISAKPESEALPSFTLLTPSQGNDEHVSRDTQFSNRNPTTAFSQSSPATLVEGTYISGYSIEAPTATLTTVTDGHMDAPFLSAPYLATGLVRPFRCPEPNGHFPDLKNCAAYYHCSQGHAYRRDCPLGTVFHSFVQTCVTASLSPPCSNTYVRSVQEDENLARITCKNPNGLYKDELSCTHYYECTNGWPIRRKCLVGTVFDDAMGKCSWSKFVPGCEQDMTPEPEVGNLVQGLQRFQCPRDGYFRDSDQCDVYYLCAGGQAMRMTCDSGTSFDVTLNMCAWSNLVDGCKDNDELEFDEAKEDNIVMSKAKTDFIRTAASFQKKASSLNTAPFRCPEAHGLYSDPYNCSYFIHCFKKVAYRHQCQPGTVFSTANAACTWQQLVPECQNKAGVKSRTAEELSKNSIAHSMREHLATDMENYQQQLSASDIVPKFKVQSVGLQEFTCPAVVDGFYRDNVFCDIFHRCVLGTRFTFTCPAGTFFRLEETLCDFWETVTDCTQDGVRQDAMHSLPDVVPLPHLLPLPKPVSDVSVSIDADPVPCPASSGLFPHPTNCRQFILCAHFVPLVLTCPDSLLYNSETLTCDFSKNVQCYKYDEYGDK